MGAGNGNGVELADVPQKARKKDGSIDWNYMDVDIERQGSKITLPKDPREMPIDDAIKALQRKKEAEEQLLDTHEIIDAYPLDGAVAFLKALQRKYGWANPVPTPGFFGPQLPDMITVDIDVGVSVQVPWGQFQVPGIEKNIGTSSIDKEHGPVFVIYGKVRKREATILKELAELTREIVAKESIYRGKAIRLRTDEDGDVNFKTPPQFIATADTKPEELILPAETASLVETNIFTLIKHTDACRQHKIPLKRGVLLEGPYGCGKTLTAAVTAKHCVANGWTYITLDRCQGLKAALEFAKRYEPAVIFAEDIDRATEDRDEETNDIMNTLDGQLSKNSQIMVVLTTNHVDKITQGMLRPGRLDAVISISAPDADAAIRLVRQYARNLLPAKANLERLGAKLSGTIPAVIREVVERAKLGMIGREAKQLSEDDLLTAADGMHNHLRLLNRKVEEEETPGDLIGRGLASIILAGDQLGKAISGPVNVAEYNVKEVIRQSHRNLNNAINGVNNSVGGVGGTVLAIQATTGQINDITTATLKDVKEIRKKVG